MKRGIVLGVVLLVLAGLGTGGWWFFRQNPEWLAWLQDEGRMVAESLGLGGQQETGGLVASGFIEAEEVSVTAEQGGRIVALHADEGDEVTEQQVLVELDDDLLLAQIRSAEAELRVAEATLAQVKAGARPETLNHALAQLDQARVAERVARVAAEDAQAMAENPQELALALTAARAELGVLDFQARQALAMANSAQAGQDLTDAAVQLLEDIEPGTIKVRIGPNKYIRVRVKVPVVALDEARQRQAEATYDAWAAWTGVAQAQAAHRGAEDYAAELARQVANPMTLQVQADTARSQYEAAIAAVGLAEAQVEGLRLGATPEQIAATEAQVEMARAALDALRVQAGQFMLEAPISGLVLARPVHSGEVALPGAPLMTLADLDHLTLTVYVAEDRIGRVHLGQTVDVTVDAYPGRTFAGTVTYVANEAEFTPKNVQTREERVNMVFAVKIELPNPEHALKPGMPADALLAMD